MMAEGATPAVDMNTIGAGASKDKSAQGARPEKPDEEQYKADLAKAEKELKTSEERMKQIKSKVDIARPNNKDSPSAKRQQELRTELQTIRTQQQSSKSSRGQLQDKIKRLDENLKSRIAEQRVARNKVQFKSVDEIDQRIAQLQKQVDSNTMKIVDERKALADITMLNRQKKGFAGFDEAQKGIDQVKSQIAELKKSMDDPESKALADRYMDITTELDKIKAEQDDVYKNLNALRDERTKAHEDQQNKYFAVKEIKDKYFQSRRAYTEYDREARRIRAEKKRVEDDAYHRGRRQEAAKAKLDDASAPAYHDEIRTTQALLAHFDPGSAAKQEVAGPGKFAATASRTVDASGFKGTALRKKDEDEENYYVGGGGKKGRKGRKQQPNGAGSPVPIEGKFNLDLGTIEKLAEIDVDPPMQQSDLPTVIDKLKAKLTHWMEDRDRKTKENIAKAQAEIDRLEAEANAIEEKEDGGSTETARTPATEKQQVNGQASAGAQAEQEKDAAADVTEDMGKAKIDDENVPEGSA